MMLEETGIELSVVTGTYNRLSHLQKMVQSVRHALGGGVGVPYEIVLVDGGSTDGTIEWCKSQPDVVLVEQGELVGAVKAFNAGFEKARGRYVIAANDDIIFIDEGILNALSYMHAHPDVGVGCFWQDRGGQNWHLEYMPAILDGRQVQHIYGQVCIVPRFLGILAGWWGDYTYTYGGDNHLSSAILELGYKIVGIPCACIHDMRVEDGLREINNAAYRDPAQAARRGQPHNDSVTWGLRWTRENKMCGAVIRHEPVVENTLDIPIRIFYAPIYEPGHPVQKTSKHGLRDALSEVGLVMEYDYMGACAEHGKEYGVQYTFDLAQAWNPHIFVFQIQGTGEYDSGVMGELRSEHPNAVFVNWNGDYHPEVLFDHGYMNLLRQFHLTGLVTTQVTEEYAQQGIQWFYWQIGYEESDADPLPDTPKHDIVFLGNGYSDVRHTLGKDLISMRKHDYDIGIYGSWPKKFGANGNTLYDFDAGQRLYRAAKFAVSDNQWVGATGFVSNRLFQAMAAGGALFMQQHFDGMELLGLVDGEHLVVWDTFEEFWDKIEYYVAHENERKCIADAGTKYILENHSFHNRVGELAHELQVRGLWPMYR